MINSEQSDGSPEFDDDRVNRIVEAGPGGALALAGLSTALVVAIWFAFYFLVFLPRGALQ